MMMMMMKSVFWWRKPEYPEETTDLRQATDETFHTYGLCPVRGLNLGHSGVKQSDLRRDESGALAHRATAVPHLRRDESGALDHRATADGGLRITANGGSMYSTLRRKLLTTHTHLNHIFEQEILGNTFGGQG